jgi:serine/threonine protein kinase/HEAT repeat protein
MTTGAQTCPDCGNAMPNGGLAGLCPACLLQQGASFDTAPSSAFLPPELGELAEIFPQLEIIGLIGAGGMGAVYKARQRELDRIVALKILPPGIGDRPGFADRFTREAKALAKLSHPGIVTIHDTGRADGLYYLLMEFVDGVNLRQLIEAGRVSPREALAIVPAICDALQYAHDCGVVHRDIKPENILLDRQGRVKVADFGLAKLVGAGDGEMAGSIRMPTHFTQAGQVMGTPQYMAPEQFEHPAGVDHRADIYSLGVVIYQMLTGELPDRSLEPPSRKVQIDVRLDEVVLRAMERNPDQRYQQASQVKTFLETIIATPQNHNKEGTRTMDIKFNCPGCNQSFSVDESAAGAEVQCPECAQSMIVPAAPAVPLVPAAPPPAPQFSPASRFAPHTPLAAPPKRAKGLAIWALVLGIIGIIPIVGLATGLIALVLGIVALVKQTTSKGMAIAGTILGALGSLMIPFHIIVLTGAMFGMKFSAQNTVCMSNLKTIGTAMVSYREKNGGNYPDNLETLEKAGLVPAKALRCPLHDGQPGQTSYEYIRPSGPGEPGIIAWDRHPHTAKNVPVGRNVLYANGSVRFLNEQMFAQTPKAARHSARPPQPPARPTAPSQTGGTPRPPQTPRPEPPPAPVEEPMTLAKALDDLKTTSPREMRPLMKFLQDSPVEEKDRAAVIAAIQPLLNDVDAGNMAFDVFARWADKEQVPELIEFVRVEPKSHRGKESMKLLSRMGDARAAEPIAACLTDFHILRDAKAALAALGEIAKPAVLPFYQHENGSTRETARELLRGYKATDEELFAETIKAIEKGSVGSRRSAIQDLTTGQLNAAQQAAASRALRPLVIDPERAVNDPARKAMKTLATPADADFLLEQLSSTDDWLRQFATDLLVQFKEPRAAKPLAELLPDTRKTHAAGRSLIALGSIAEPAVMPYLSHNDPNARKRAAEVLGEIGTSASLPALQKVAKDSNFFAKVAAERAITAIKARPAKR